MQEVWVSNIAKPFEAWFCWVTSTASARAPGSINPTVTRSIKCSQTNKHGDPHTSVISNSARLSGNQCNSNQILRHVADENCMAKIHVMITNNKHCMSLSPSSINHDWINQVQPNKHFWWHWLPKNMVTPIYNSDLIYCNYEKTCTAKACT